MAHLPRDDRRSIRAWLIAIFIIFAMLGLSLGTWLSRLPSVRDHLGASTFEMSMYVLALSVGSLSGLLLSTRIVTHFGSVRTLQVSMAIQPVALIVAVGLFWFGPLVAGMAGLFCFGVAFGISDVAANVNGATAERRDGRPRMPVIHGAFSLGTVVAMGVGALAEATDFPVPLHVVIAMILMGVVSFVALRWVGDEREEPLVTVKTEKDPAASVLTGPIPVTPALSPATEYVAWRDPRTYLLGLIALTMSLAEGIGADWIALALVDGRGFSNAVGTTMAGVFLGSMLVARMFGSPLLSRFGRTAVIRSGALVCGIGIVVMIVVPAVWAPAVGAALWGLGSGLGFPVAISAAADDPTRAVRRVAAVSIIAYAAFLIGPVVIGVMGEHLGLLTAFWPLVGFMVLCVIIAGALRERGPSNSRSQT